MLLTSLLASAVIGFFLFYTGLTQRIEHKSREIFPEYGKHIENRQQRVGDFLKRNGYTKQDMQNPEIREEAMELLDNKMKEVPLKPRQN